MVKRSRRDLSRSSRSSTRGATSLRIPSMSSSHALWSRVRRQPAKRAKPAKSAAGANGPHGQNPTDVATGEANPLVTKSGRLHEIQRHRLPGPTDRGGTGTWAPTQTRSHIPRDAATSARTEALARSASLPLTPGDSPSSNPTSPRPGVATKSCHTAGSRRDLTSARPVARPP